MDGRSFIRSSQASSPVGSIRPVPLTSSYKKSGERNQTDHRDEIGRRNQVSEIAMSWRIALCSTLRCRKCASKSIGRQGIVFEAWEVLTKRTHASDAYSCRLGSFFPYRLSQGTRVLLTACRKEAKASFHMSPTNPYRLEGATLADRPAATGVCEKNGPFTRALALGVRL